MVHPNAPSNAVKVRTSNFDINLTEPSLAMTTSSGSQLTMNTYSLSMETTSYHSQSGPHLIELHRQLLPALVFLESPKPLNKNQKHTFRNFDLLDTSPTTNFPSLPKINSVLQELQGLVPHAHPEIANQATGCKVRGKPNNQVIEQTAADYLHHTVEPGETNRDRNIK